MYPDELYSTLWCMEIKKNKLIDAYTSICFPLVALRAIKKNNFAIFIVYVLAFHPRAFTTQFCSRIQVYVTCMLENSEKKNL